MFRDLFTIAQNIIARSINKKILSLILFSFFFNSAICQLYFAKKGNDHFYVNITKDSARVEIFHQNRFDWVYKRADEKLLPTNEKKDTIFTGKQNQIIKRKTEYLLVYSFDSKKLKTINLELCKKDLRAWFRQNYYINTTQRSLTKLRDSLSGPFKSMDVDIRGCFKSLSRPDFSYNEFVLINNKIADSLRARIIGLKDPIIDHYYNVADSLTFVDSTTVFSILSKTKYNFYYGKYFLNKVALIKPDYLVRYIEKKPANKDTVLLAIRYHSNLDGIVKSVIKSPLERPAKKEIVKQQRKNTGSNVAGYTIYISIILAELAALALLVVFIARL